MTTKRRMSNLKRLQRSRHPKRPQNQLLHLPRKDQLLLEKLHLLRLRPKEEVVRRRRSRSRRSGSGGRRRRRTTAPSGSFFNTKVLSLRPSMNLYRTTSTSTTKVCLIRLYHNLRSGEYVQKTTIVSTKNNNCDKYVTLFGTFSTSSPHVTYIFDQFAKSIRKKETLEA
jgi:hypothetical protein